jgi:hypothetical protein
MTKREKRLEKGIESIEKQIQIHKEKLAKAKEDKDEYLENYYLKEIEALVRTKDLKKSKLER